MPLRAIDQAALPACPNHPNPGEKSGLARIPPSRSPVARGRAALCECSALCERRSGSPRLPPGQIDCCFSSRLPFLTTHLRRARQGARLLRRAWAVPGSVEALVRSWSTRLRSPIPIIEESHKEYTHYRDNVIDGNCHGRRSSYLHFRAATTTPDVKRESGHVQDHHHHD